MKTKFYCLFEKREANPFYLCNEKYLNLVNKINGDEKSPC
jgi:hypothetical protein